MGINGTYSGMFPSLSGAGNWSPEIAVGAGMTGIIPANIKFNLFGTIGSKFKVATGRYRRQQTVFSTRLGTVHGDRVVCLRRWRKNFLQ
ncbi:MAG: hypothetical protein DWH78_03380 [Planctomycetota bacterium]|nr:MAG: hypothetical protein DWH78_03380 [Planctomycetota bacterium]